MSQKKAKTSGQIRNEFDDVSHKIGIETGNARRAKSNLALLEKRQAELEAEFSSAIQREQEFEKQNKDAAAKTEAFEAKAGGAVNPPTEATESGEVSAAS